uniref:Predicted protein n=1 Tax=Hordeum vulgare subsp. vulgare TaxID=112509 RepID=F2E031_HORVV|nr:predicted protein [Hordeum vulgare subsp. vulgare]
MLDLNMLMVLALLAITLMVLRIFEICYGCHMDALWTTILT